MVIGLEAYPRANWIMEGPRKGGWHVFSYPWFVVFDFFILVSGTKCLRFIFGCHCLAHQPFIVGTQIDNWPYCKYLFIYCFGSCVVLCNYVLFYVYESRDGHFSDSHEILFISFFVRGKRPGDGHIVWCKQWGYNILLSISNEMPWISKLSSCGSAVSLMCQDIFFLPNLLWSHFLFIDDLRYLELVPKLLKH